MNISALTESLKESSRHMVRETLRDMEKLNANNLSWTIMALIAYNGAGRSQLVNYLCRQLLKKQLDNGSWMDELWATGLALLAIHKYLEHQNRPFNYRAPHVRKALEYVDSTWSDQRSDWQGELIESILLCWVLLKTEHQKKYTDVTHALERLNNFRREGGFFDVYDTALALCAFNAARMTLKMSTDELIDTGLKWLRKWDCQKESVWNNSVTLFTIAEIGEPDKGWTDRIITSLTENTDEGVISDDHDVQAMAILALASFLNSSHPEEFNKNRISVDRFLRTASKLKELRESKKRQKVIVNAMNAGVPTQLIIPERPESIKELPQGYPAYCVYIPTGTEQDFEQNTIATLKVWRKSMGKNLCVAPWDVGDPSYPKLLALITKIRHREKRQNGQPPIRRPAIFMTDNNMPDEKSFMIILDDLSLLMDNTRLMQILVHLVDSILLGEKKEAMKDAVRASQIKKISVLLRGVGAALGKVKVTFAMDGVTVEAAG